jgi:hypothetical protein
MTISLNDLKLVNTKINLLPYATEIEDDWVPIVTEGDCDSAATAKFERLVQMACAVPSLGNMLRRDWRVSRCPASRLGRPDVGA